MEETYAVLGVQESAILPTKLYFPQGLHMPMLQERHVPTSDDKPTPLTPIPANAYESAGPEQLRRAETDHREPRIDVPIIGRATTPVREKFYIRMLDTVLRWVFVIGLFFWKYLLRTPFSDQGRKRPDA